MTLKQHRLQTGFMVTKGSVKKLFQILPNKLWQQTLAASQRSIDDDDISVPLTTTFGAKP